MREYETLKKKWKIYVIHQTHTDIGYTDGQEIITARQIDFIRQAVEISEAIASGEKKEWDGFRWVCETFWGVEQFWEQADESWRTRFLKAVKRGNIEVTGNYLNLCEAVDEHTLRHYLHKAANFAGDEGIAMDCAMTSDINGYSWGYASLLHEAGIRKLFSCVHNHHGMFPLFQKQTPFYWETKEGERLLVWNGDHYQLGNEMGIVPDAVHSYIIRDEFQAGAYMEGQEELSEKRICRYLQELERENYPFTFVPLNVTGLVTDNAPPNPRIMEFINRWNKKYGGYVTMEMTTLSHFFQEVTESGYEIPVYRGDWPDWWSDGAGSASRFTKICRQAQSKLKSILALDPGHRIVSQKELDEIYWYLMLYSEHTFSYSASMEEPWNENVNLISEQKHGYAVEANRLCNIALGKIRTAKGEILLGPANPMHFKLVNGEDRRAEGIYRLGIDSWERPLLERGFAVRDMESKEILPSQYLRTARGADVYVTASLDGGKERMVEVIPEPDGRGHSTDNYDMTGVDGVKDVQGLFQNPAAEVRTGCIETEYLGIQWKESEGITSWYDKMQKKELILPDRKHAAFQPVYEVTPLTGSDDYCSVRRNMGRNRKGAGVVRTAGRFAGARTACKGEVFTDIEFSYELPGVSYYVMNLRVFHHFAQVDASVRIHKDSVWEPENLYLSLPFGLRDGKLWIEKTGAVLRPGVDQLPGTNRDYYCLQAGYGISGNDGWVAVNTADVPLLWTGPLEYGSRILNDNSPMDDAKLYSWIMNNYWETNFDAASGGFYEFTYRIRSGAGTVSPEELMDQVHQMNRITVSFRAKE